MFEDVLVVDASTITTACAAGPNVDIRAYDKTGKLTKTLASPTFARRPTRCTGSRG